MQHNKTIACPFCPYKKNSLPGYLGGASVQEFHRDTMRDDGMPCHIDLEKRRDSGDYDDEEMEDFKDELIDHDVEQCAGALVYARQAGKIYTNKDLVRQTSKLLPHDDIMSVKEFMEHHKETI